MGQGPHLLGRADIAPQRRGLQGPEQQLGPPRGHGAISFLGQEVPAVVRIPKGREQLRLEECEQWGRSGGGPFPAFLASVSGVCVCLLLALFPTSIRSLTSCFLFPLFLSLFLFVTHLSSPLSLFSFSPPHFVLLERTCGPCNRVSSSKVNGLVCRMAGPGPSPGYPLPW